jgi:hypothetical protein
VLAQQALEQDRLLPVAAEPVELVHDDEVHVVLAAEADHLAEAGATVGGRVGADALVDELADDGGPWALGGPGAQRLALSGDGVVLLGLFVRGHAAVGDDLRHR